MADPVTGAPLRALLVADLDLDTGQLDVREPLIEAAEPVDGVHAVVWLHQRPIGEVTVLGDPDDVLLTLPEEARRRLVFRRWQHLLHDAVSTQDGLRLARASGLEAVPHPPSPRQPELTVTVAVCTRDRPESLRTCLQSLTALRDPVLEVLVVDNASRDERTRQVTEQFPGVRYVREPRRGLDWARNRAAHEARGDIIAYTDDDAEPHPGWIGGLLEAFVEEPTAVCVTGLVVPRDLATPAQVLFEAVGGFGRGYRRRWFSAAVRQGEVAAAVFGGSGVAGTGANMAFRRGRLLELGGFDTALDVGTPTGGGGDLEMFFRVVAAGDLLVYEPSAVVRHQHRPDMATLLRQMRGHGTGSYSYFLGAGRHYGSRQARQFRRLARWWAVHHHLAGYARAVAAPALLPLEMRLQESRGAWDATVHSYYGRSQRQAARELATHGGPVPGPLVRRAALPPQPRVADPCVTVELLSAGPAQAVAAVTDEHGRRVRVRALRDGSPQHVFTSHVQGSALSAVRLRWELVDHLGPALLQAGLSYDGPAGTSVGGPVVTTEQQEGCPPLTARQLEVMQEALDGRPELYAAAQTGPRIRSVTVLLCTRDRPEHLRRVLARLAAQAFDGQVQVLVVDNSRDPRTTLALAAERDHVTVLHQPRPGLSRARNLALPHIAGEVLVFVDDDVLPPPQWLDRLVAPFADPTIAMVTGDVLPADVAGLSSQLFEDYGGLGRGPHRLVYEPEWLHRHKHAVPTWTIGATANAAVRSDWCRRLGPFVEHLGAGNAAGVGEDTEYFYRVLRSGGRILYEPTAWVEHEHRGDRAGLERQLRDYSAGHVAYHAELALRYRDLRGARRVALGLPRQFARRLSSSLRGRDDYPADLIWAEIRGHVHGPAAWLRSRWTGR